MTHDAKHLNKRPSSRRRVIKRVIAGAILSGAGAIALLTTHLFEGNAQAIPVFAGTYSIDATSGTHHASLLNLPLGQPGVIEAPIPVDVDGDLLPDVAVSVNLQNTNGIFNNPPNPGAVLAPNIQINRLITAPILGQPSPPLRIEVVLTIGDSSGGPSTTIRFGYDTGVGGSIPLYYTALVGGLNNFFNPLTAAIDTTGTLLGLQPNINLLGLGAVAAPYQGPLHVIGGIQQGSSNTTLDLGYRPFPEAVRVTYGTDSAGQHITYTHPLRSQVDLTTAIKSVSGPSTTNLVARIDRLPRSIALDYNSSGTGGSVDYRSTPDGRYPDVGVTLNTSSPGTRPLNANVDIDALPAVMHGEWSIPSGGGPVHAAFCSPAAPSASPCTAPQGPGIGAIQATVTNFNPGDATTLSPYVPDQQQFLNFQQATNPAWPGNPDMRITGRVERVRHLDFSNSATGGFNALAQLGDGEQPLVAHVQTDTRPATNGLYLEGTATIKPLPDSAQIAFAPASGSTPAQVTYAASQDIDVDGSFKMINQNSGGTCGTHGTICASLQARHLPAQVITKITNLPSETHLDIDATPRAGSTATDQPDFFANATYGTSDDQHPLIAQASLLGYPSHVRIFTHQDPSQSLDRAEFHACDWDFSASACRAGTDGTVGQISFNIRNWQARPVDLPPPSPTTTAYASLVARGTADPNTILFEAAGKLTDITEVDYRNTGGIFGVRTRIGTPGQNFSAHVDLGNIDLAPSDPNAHRFDALGDVTIQSLPSSMDVCYRTAGQPILPPSGTFVAPCEDANPFSDPSALTVSPITFAYRANTPFNVLTNAKIVDHDPANAANNRTYFATVNVDNLPKNMTVNVVTPPTGTTGPYRALYCSGSQLPGSGTCPTAAPTDPQPSIHFSGGILDGDLICKDPRVPLAGHMAVCASGLLQNLPSSAYLLYDPSLPSDNLVVKTSGEHQMDLIGDQPCPAAPKCFEFSSVTRDDSTGLANDLIAQGAITGLPLSVTGTLHVPSSPDEPPSVELVADPPLGHVDAIVRNYIAPDPIQASVPTRTIAGFGTPTQTVTYFQRGSAFRAEAHISLVKSVGYKTVAATDGSALDTKVMDLGFGNDPAHPNQVIRAYADIEPSPADRTIADASVNNVPLGLNVCFRGKDTHPGLAPASGQATFCDTGDSAIPVTDSDGSFQVVSTPPASGALPSIDAFIRQASGGGSSILSGRVHVDGIPRQVEGTFPSDTDTGNLDVGAFTPGSGGSLTPTGINHIDANVATFDLDPADTGYGSGSPFIPQVNTNAPFPVVPSTTHQYAKAILDNGAFQARLSLGPDSQLQRVTMTRQACAAPPNNPPDYPRFPSVGPGGTTDPKKIPLYTCISGNFIQHVTNAPLDVQFLSLSGSQQMSFDGGLTDLPNHIQMTLTDVQGQTDSARVRCGFASAAIDPTTNPTDCLPPLVRFDQPANSVLFGTMKYGSVGDLGALDNVHVASGEDMTNLDAVPTGDGTTWSDWTPDETGVRAKLGAHNGATAAKVGIRIKVPQSLTIDQVQSYSKSSISSQPEYWQASDTRFHYVIRDSAGNPVGGLGEMAAMYNDIDDGYQFLVSNPCSTLPGTAIEGAPINLAQRSSPGTCSDFNRGVPIPGELGIDFYRRSHTGNGKDFFQIDGRASDPGRPLSIGVRMVAIGEQASVGRLEAAVDNVPTTTTTASVPIGPNDPTFRLRFEMVGNGSAPPSGAPAPPPSSGSDCSPFFCATSDVKIASVYAYFDFNPTSSANPARLVDAVVNQVGSTEQGFEARGYQHTDAAVTDTPDAPVSAGAMLDINPLDFYIHAGISGLGGADLVFQSQLQAAFHLDEVKDYTLRHNTLHIKIHDDGPGTASTLGPVNLYIYQLHAEADLLFVPLLTIDFLPPSLPPSFDQLPGPPAGPLNLEFFPCSPLGALAAANTLYTPSGIDTNTVLWPFDPLADPRMIYGGILGPLFDAAGILATPFFCLTGTDASDIPLAGHFSTGDVPGDPVGNTRTGHPVPGAPDDSTPPTSITLPSDVTPPNYTESGTVGLCGVHQFNTLVVNGTLNVATTADSTNTTGSGPNCPSGSEGTLTLEAANVTVSGSINANAIISATSPTLPHGDPGPLLTATGLGGGGHGAAGGAGTTGGIGGFPYGNQSRTDPTTEMGVRGAGSRAGNGGGSITIETPGTVTVNSGGSITANGASPSAGVTACDSTATAGASGGAGGGISISAIKVANSGTISANGGFGSSGGAGAGGGGASGIVKIIAPLQTGNAPQSVGHSGGTDPCASATAGAGGSLSPIRNTDNQSTALPITTTDSTTHVTRSVFWHQASTVSPHTELDVPFEGAAADGGHGSVVFLCRSYLSASQLQAAETANQTASPKKSFNGLFTMPTSGPGVYSGFITHFEPCGTSNVFVGGDYSPLGDVTTSSQQFSGTINANQATATLADGYYGFWTVTAVAKHSGDDCTNPLTWIAGNCEVEANPATVDVVIGVDNTNPDVVINNPTVPSNPAQDAFLTNSANLEVDVTAHDDAQLSDLDKVEYSFDDTNFSPMNNGQNQIPLPSSDGEVTVYVRATDNAGNHFERSFHGLVDRQPPTSSATLSGGVINNGWYRVLPTITLHGADGGSGLNTTSAFVYRFDDGTDRPTGTDPVCTGSPCTIPASVVAALSTGAHTLYFTAVDQAGNRLADDATHMNKIAVDIDTQRPQSAQLSVPAAPDGANGWYTVHPWVSISANDQPGASGLTPGSGDNPVAGIYVYKDGVLQPAQSPPFTPFQFGAGQHDVCWFVRDVAGNRDVDGAGGPSGPDPTAAGVGPAAGGATGAGAGAGGPAGPDPTAAELAAAGQCQHFMVDDAPPTVSINPTPGAPNGGAGWYTSTVPVTLTASDGIGSGVNPAFDPADASLLCAPAPKTTDPRPSGICLSIDGAAFVPYTAGFTIPEGTHDVRAFSVDVSGQRSSTQELPINVDLSPPVASARVTPPSAAQNGWWRSAPYPGAPAISPPMVTLRAVDGDQNSGVAVIQYKVNPTASTPWSTYTTPFSVPEGVNTVQYRAIDNAGNVQPTQTLTIPVDVTPPVVVATSPSPAIWLQVLSPLGNILGLSPSKAKLQWTVSDNLSQHVHITVLVYNFGGAVVRQLDGGTYATTPGTTLSGSTLWDGKDQTITKFVPVGLYYYRVVATDDAGNVSQSGESRPIQIKVP